MAMEQRTFSPAETLRNKGLRPSRQRVAIYSFLLENRIHPTADCIYRKLSPHYPTLSLTTVYNTLKLLVKAGLVTPLTIEDDEVRYDAETEFHAHFRCRICGRISDCFVSAVPSPDAAFQLESVHLDYYGICPECRKKHQ